MLWRIHMEETEGGESLCDCRICRMRSRTCQFKWHIQVQNEWTYIRVYSRVHFTIMHEKSGDSLNCNIPMA